MLQEFSMEYICTVSTKKMPCVPEFKYVTCDIQLYIICTVSVKNMHCEYEKDARCATKDASVPNYNKRCPDVPCLDILHTLGYEGNTLIYYSPTSLPNSPNL